MLWLIRADKKVYYRFIISTLMLAVLRSKFSFAYMSTGDHAMVELFMSQNNAADTIKIAVTEASSKTSALASQARQDGTKDKGRVHVGGTMMKF